MNWVFKSFVNILEVQLICSFCKENSLIFLALFVRSLLCWNTWTAVTPSSTESPIFHLDDVLLDLQNSNFACWLRRRRQWDVYSVMSCEFVFQAQSRALFIISLCRRAPMALRSSAQIALGVKLCAPECVQPPAQQHHLLVCPVFGNEAVWHL